MAADPSRNPLGLPFSEAIDFFRAKQVVPSASWTDLWREQHSHAFTVAGATHKNLLEDFFTAIKSAQTNGTGYEQFQKDFAAIVQKNGWTHKGDAGWRSRIIYHTNITQSYNAGRYQQMMQVKSLRPFWQYQHNSTEHPRPAHQAWSGKILSADDPWWDSHYPQNGWGCKCTVRSLTRTEAADEWTAKGGTGPDTAPAIEWEEKTVGKNGPTPRTIRTPVGVDAGFGYNPGKSYLEGAIKHPLDKRYDSITGVGSGGQSPRPNINIRPSPAKIITDTKNWRALQNDFLATFGASEQAAVFTVADGDAVVIGQRMFTDVGTGESKFLRDSGRAKYLEFMRETLFDPDEIWESWVLEPSGNYRLKKKLIRFFEVDEAGKKLPGLSVFEWSNSGWWSGLTVFVKESKEVQLLEKERVGNLTFLKDK